MNAILHVGSILSSNGRREYLFLLQEKDRPGYCWFTQKHLGDLQPTSCEGSSIDEALNFAAKKWKEDYFSLLHCGFLYALPIRDEVGTNALFSQMIASYSSPSGIYLDKALGHQCFVDYASQEALQLWHSLRHL